MGKVVLSSGRLVLAVTVLEAVRKVWYVGLMMPGTA